MNRSLRQTGRRRGFTLLELMVASSLSLIVLAAALWSAAELQRRGTFEESLMEAQNTLRAVRELLVVEIQRAGMGVGSARMMFGTQGRQIDPRYALTIRSREIFDGTGYFPRDTSFAPPSSTGPYAGLVSDVLQVWSWDSGAVDDVDSPIGMVTLRACQHPESPNSYRVGNTLCATDAPEGLAGRLVMVVRPGKLSHSACVMRVTQVSTDFGALGNPSVLTIAPGLSAGHMVTDSVCSSIPNANQPAGDAFWQKGNDAEIYLLLMRGSTFRVNWRSGRPVLERQDVSSRNETSAWTALTQDVETLRLWQGVMPDPRLPSSDVQWMPETGARIPGFQVQDLPPIETCPRPQRPYCSDLVASLPRIKDVDQQATDPLVTERERLMYRMRMVRVEIVTRTARLDSSLIRQTGPNSFLPDENGRPQDGYKRRSSTLEIMPRNFAFASGRP